eukprot:12010222-Alexandrium_andersonii.AAC.1
MRLRSRRFGGALERAAWARETGGLFLALRAFLPCAQGSMSLRPASAASCDAIDLPTWSVHSVAVLPGVP